MFTVFSICSQCLVLHFISKNIHSWSLLPRGVCCCTSSIESGLDVNTKSRMDDLYPGIYVVGSDTCCVRKLTCIELINSCAKELLPLEQDRLFQSIVGALKSPIIRCSEQLQQKCPILLRALFIICMT